MHIQLVTFQLRGLDAEQYRAATTQLAPYFADMPGLHAKIWLANPASNSFGGVYLWQSRAAMEDYCASELFQSVLANAQFADVRSVDYPILEEPTRLTWKLP